MDVRHYFDPVDFSAFSGNSRFPWKYSLGQSIERSTGRLTLSNIHQLEIVIVGVPCNNRNNAVVPSKSTDKIREELYRLCPPDSRVNIADLGNLKETKNQKGIYFALRDVTEYFAQLGVVTVVIGGSQDLTIGICEAFKNKPYFSLSCVDAFLDVKKGKELLDSTSFLTRIFNANPDIFQFSLLGYQSHYVAPALFSKTKGLGIHLRLGLLRDNISQAEPVLRNTDVLSLDMGSVKYSEAPGTETVNPNGLQSEEACQLAKYAGLNNRLKVFGLFNVISDVDINGLTSKLSAQVIWYFLEGFVSRSPEKPGGTGNFLMYKVEISDVDKPLVFIYSKDTFRWWMEIESLNGEKVTIACSEREYQQAANNEIPELWLKYVQKTDELSK